MLDDLLQMFAGRSIGQIALGVVDIIAVTIVIYRLLLVLKGTRAAQIGVGIFLVFLTYIAARWIGLVTLETLFSGLLSSAILLIIIVFQNDIRRALHRIGSSSFFGSWGHALEERVIEEVVGAATELARHRVGAIIAFERHANLDEFLSGQGIIVDAAVSKELLITTFIPESANKLHDGAVIIRALRIAKAGVFFPMPESKTIDPTYGSRHRAALGITEEADAIVVVVSEERGTISVCFNGNIVNDVNGEQLRTMLLRNFGRALATKKDKKAAEAREGHSHPGRVAVMPATRPSMASKSSPGMLLGSSIAPGPGSANGAAKDRASLFLTATSTPLTPSPSSASPTTATSTPMPTSITTPVDRNGNGSQ